MTLTKQTPRPSAHHRKRTGQHHKHNQHYIKAYWPYLPVFAVLLLGIFGNAWLVHAHHNVLGYATDVSNTSLLELTNQQRVGNNEQSLTLSDSLSQAASKKAADMATRNYWAHVTPDGKQPWTFIAAAGYNYQAAGENLAYGFGDAEQITNAWMHSTEHRANILNAQFAQVGFGTANVANYLGQGPETIVVAMYAEPADAASAPKQNLDLTTQSQAVSQLQLSTGALWSDIALAILCGAALMLFFVRHALAWHKVLVKSERFVLKHPFLDVFLMSAAVLSFLLSHAAGTIL